MRELMTIKKAKCIKCGAEACWFYECRASEGFCENCVPRSCHCSWNEEINDYIRDELGRIIPCADYMYFEEGMDEELSPSKALEMSFRKSNVD